MTAIEIVNLALLKIGVSQGIAALDESSREAWTGALIYDTMLRATLRHFPWPFATKYLALTLTQGPAWADDALVQAWAADQTYAIGDIVEDADVVYYATAVNLASQPPSADWETDPTTEANGDWLYAYRWPDDCLFGRRMVSPGMRRTFNPTPIPFRVGRDPNGLLFYTNQAEALLEYTTIDCTSLWADDLWLDAFTWRLAAALAPSLSRIPKMAETCMAMYARTIETARAVASQEGQQDPPGEAEWIRGR